jgi:hypothetical protein
MILWPFSFAAEDKDVHGEMGARAKLPGLTKTNRQEISVNEGRITWRRNKVP